jgi:hypothetical protein
MKRPVHYLIAEVPVKRSKIEVTIGMDLGDVWSHYCTLNEQGEVTDRGLFGTSPKGVEKWFTDVPPARVAMEAGTHSIWISEQLEELGHQVIVATAFCNKSRTAKRPQRHRSHDKHDLPEPSHSTSPETTIADLVLHLGCMT